MSVAWDTDFCTIGKLKVTPIGSSSCRSKPHSRHALSTTVATLLPMKENKLSAFSFFKCSPMGHDCSRSLRRQGCSCGSALDPFTATSLPFSASNSTKPTLRFVPPLRMLVSRCPIRRTQETRSVSHALVFRQSACLHVNGEISAQFHILVSRCLRSWSLSVM